MPAAGAFSNGFAALEEVESIRVGSQCVAPFSLPREALTFEAGDDVVFQKLRSGDRERRIHCNTELRKEELQDLERLQEAARSQGVSLLPSVSVNATRYLGQAKGDHGKALANMARTNEWRLSYFKDGPVTERQVMDDLRRGALYFSGRDSCLRPALIFRTAKIPSEWLAEPSFTRLVRCVVFCMEYFLRFMVVPGRIETLNLIIDVHALKFAKRLLEALKEVGRSMAKYYIGRMAAIRVVNMSPGLRMLANMAKGVLSDRTKQKLYFLESPKELQHDFAPQQLEEDLGGSRPVFEKFFPFPLAPGPFHGAGGKGGAGNSGATTPSRVTPVPSGNQQQEQEGVPGVHRALTPAGARGRLWEPSRSYEENTSLEYTQEAPEILARCGLQPPASSAVRPTRSDGTVQGELGIAQEEKIIEGRQPKAENDHESNSTTSSPEEEEPDSTESQACHRIRSQRALAAIMSFVASDSEDEGDGGGGGRKGSKRSKEPSGAHLIDESSAPNFGWLCTWCRGPVL